MPKAKVEPKDDGAVAQATIKRLAKQAAKCDHLAVQVTSQKSTLKAIQADYDRAVEELRSMSREPTYPLLDTSDEWRGIDIMDLGLSTKLTGLLADAIDGHTMGHLADWLKADHAVIQITGFGPAAIEKFDDAMEKFWKDHPQPEEEGEDEDEE